MAAVPAACTQCGSIFWSQILLGSVKNIEFRNNSTTCPTCGGIARIADGLFDFTREGIRVLSAPDVTHDMLVALRAVVVRAYREQWPEERIKQEAEAISPKLGGLFWPESWSPEVKAAWIIALFALIASLITAQEKDINISIDAESIINAIHALPADQVIEGTTRKNPEHRIIGPPKPKPAPKAGPAKPNPKRKPPPSKPKRKPKRRRR